MISHFIFVKSLFGCSSRFLLYSSVYNTVQTKVIGKIIQVVNVWSVHFIGCQIGKSKRVDFFKCNISHALKCLLTIKLKHTFI